MMSGSREVHVVVTTDFNALGEILTNADCCMHNADLIAELTSSRSRRCARRV